MIRLVLASQSPARLATLRAAGVNPHVLVADIDEDAVLAQAAQRFGELPGEDAVLVLAKAKAEEVARTLADEDATAGDLVLGCDSMLEFGGEVVGKPASAADAIVRWTAMRGKSGVLHTGHWLIDLTGDTGATFGATSSTTVHFANLSDAEIEDYVATGEPLNVAGAFTIDGLGGPYIERIEGDHHGVVGLSLPLLRTMLGELGIVWSQLRESQPREQD